MDKPYSDRLSDGRTSPNNSSPLSVVVGDKSSLHTGFDFDFDVAEDRLGANLAPSFGAPLGRETIRSFGTAGFDVEEDLLDANPSAAVDAPLGTEGGMTVGSFAFAVGLVDDRFFDNFLIVGLDVFLATAEEDADIFTCSFSLFPALLDDFDAW